MSTSLGTLVDAVAALESPLEVFRLVGAAFVEVVPRGLAGVFAFADWPAREVLAVGAVTREGVRRSVELDYERAFPTTYLGYDRRRVAAGMRDRWVEPLAGISDADRFRRSAGYRAVFAPEGLWWHGRRVYCVGERPVAYACACLPEDDTERFTEAERHALEAVSDRVAPVLRAVAAYGAAQARRAALDHALAERPDPCFVVSATGVLAASPAGVRALDADPELREVAHALVAASPTAATSARHRGRVVSVTPCSPRGGSTAWLVVLDDAVGGRRRLTPRQIELLELLERGLTNREIGDALGLSPSSVKTMLERLYRRTGTRGRVELLRWSRG